MSSQSLLTFNTPGRVLYLLVILRNFLVLWIMTEVNFREAGLWVWTLTLEAVCSNVLITAIPEKVDPLVILSTFDLYILLWKLTQRSRFCRQGIMWPHNGKENTGLWEVFTTFNTYESKFIVRRVRFGAFNGAVSIPSSIPSFLKTILCHCSEGMLICCDSL